MQRVEGKVVVITGAGGGQGLAEAEALAREGAVVVATDLHDEAPTPVDGVTYRKLDVSRPEDWQRLGEWARATHGQIDGLVNNAAMPLRDRLLEVQVADWDRLMAVNLRGYLLGIQTVVPLMTAGGSIVNVGSVTGLTGHYTAAYTVAKWGVRGLSRVASLELGERGIRVNTILPGYIESPMTASAPTVLRAANIAETPLGRLGTPDDVAPLVVFLISDESSYVSGAEIAVDGGQTAHGGAKRFLDIVRDT